MWFLQISVAFYFKFIEISRDEILNIDIDICSYKFHFCLRSHKFSLNLVFVFWFFYYLKLSRKNKQIKSQYKLCEVWRLNDKKSSLHAINFNLIPSSARWKPGETILNSSPSNASSRSSRSFVDFSLLVRPHRIQISFDYSVNKLWCLQLIVTLNFQRFNGIDKVK